MTNPRPDTSDSPEAENSEEEPLLWHSEELHRSSAEAWSNVLQRPKNRQLQFTPARALQEVDKPRLVRGHIDQAARIINQDGLLGLEYAIAVLQQAKESATLFTGQQVDYRVQIALDEDARAATADEVRRLILHPPRRTVDASAQWEAELSVKAEILSPSSRPVSPWRGEKATGGPPQPGISGGQRPEARSAGTGASSVPTDEEELYEDLVALQEEERLGRRSPPRVREAATSERLPRQGTPDGGRAERLGCVGCTARGRRLPRDFNVRRTATPTRKKLRRGAGSDDEDDDTWLPPGHPDSRRAARARSLSVGKKRGRPSGRGRGTAAGSARGAAPGPTRGRGRAAGPRQSKAGTWRGVPLGEDGGPTDQARSLRGRGRAGATPPPGSTRSVSRVGKAALHRQAAVQEDAAPVRRTRAFLSGSPQDEFWDNSWDEEEEGTGPSSRRGEEADSTVRIGEFAAPSAITIKEEFRLF